jgi:hypothetical protein
MPADLGQVPIHRSTLTFGMMIAATVLRAGQAAAETGHS